MNLNKFEIPKYEIEYSDKHNIQYLTINILHGYNVIESVQYENYQAMEVYSILISEDKKEIREIFKDIYINYME